jgi:hypothetical protein
VFYTGQTQTYYNSGLSSVTLATPGTGVITGGGLNGSSTITLGAYQVITLTSDGTNYIIQDWVGGTVVTQSLTATGGTINGIVIGASSAQAGTFNGLTNTAGTTTLAGGSASGIFQFTNNATSSSTTTGTIQVTGGMGVTGAINSGSLTTSNGAVTAGNQIYYPIRLSPASGTGGFGGNGQGIKFDVWSNAGISTGAAIYSAMGSGGSGGNDFSSSLILAIKKSSDSAPVEALRVDQSNGYIGINSTSPYTRLDIRGTSASAGATIQVVGTGVSTLLLGQDSDGAVVRGQGGNNMFKIYTGGTADSSATASGTERLRIDGNGIGINTTNTNTATGNYTFNVGYRARFNGMMLGNNDGTNASDNRISLDWSSGSYAQILAQQDVPLWLGQNNTQRVQVRSDGLLINSGAYYYVNEIVLTGNQSTTVSSTGPKEIFRVGSSNLVTSGIFSIAATRGNYVTGSTYSWTSSHNASGYGTITQLSSTNYTQVDVYLDIASDGSAIISINWGQGYTASFPMSYNVSVMKTCGSTLSFANAGTDWTTVATNYTRRITYSSIANGFKAENGAFVGSLSKGSGSFKIDHPLPELTDTKYLVHSFIEGPNADLIYRGEVELVAGRATVDIDQHSRMTEGTFEELCRKVQCFTTNETDWTAVRGRVAGNILTIEAQDPKSIAKVSWMVIGERKDPHMYETEWTDDNGEVIVEPLKNPVQTDFPPYPDSVNKVE